MRIEGLPETLITIKIGHTVNCSKLVVLRVKCPDRSETIVLRVMLHGFMLHPVNRLVFVAAQMQMLEVCHVEVLIAPFEVSICHADIDISISKKDVIHRVQFKCDVICIFILPVVP